MKHLLLILSLMLFLNGSTVAQPDRDQKFAVAGYIGGNFSQIDGDYYFGYNKVGVRFGIESQVLLKPKYFMTLGVGYAQAGAKPNRKEKGERGNNSVDLRINMVEVPLIFNYRLGVKTAYGKKDNYQLYRSASLQAGIILTRLTSYRINQSGRAERLPRNLNFTSVEDEFEDWDLKAVVGITVRTGLQGEIYFQHNKSFLGLYRPGDVGLDDVLPLFPYSMSLGYKHTLY